MNSAYQQDLAYIHDVGFGFHANGLAPGLTSLFKKAGLARAVVVDLGCGSGIWAAHLEAAGFHAVGVDLSPAMIDLARRRAPTADFHVASLVDFPLPSCAAITALGEVVCYQFDRRNNRQALARLLRRAYDALQPGGIFVFDIDEIGLDRNRRPTGKSGDDWACLVRIEYDSQRDQLLRHITTFRQIGRTYRRLEETHRIQLYDRGDIAGLLRQIGFRVRAVRRFGDYQLLPGRVAFIARKAKSRGK
jgi:SAM-dependent methyltransferase